MMKRPFPLLLTLAFSSASLSAAASYRVVPGDTLSEIAVRQGTTVSTLKSANNLSSSQIQVGQVLYLPAPVARAALTVTVKPGDTLWEISSTNGIGLQRLRELNQLDNDVIVPGQVLRLQPGAARIPVSVTSRPRSPWKRRSHVVVPGDTLSGIAVRYNVSMATLQRLNGLSDAEAETIEVGQTIVLPEGSQGSAQARTTLERGLFTVRPPVARAGSHYLTGLGHERQTFNNCGPAAVARVLNYYGESANQNTYKRRLRNYDPERQTFSATTSAYAIATLLRERGYQAPVYTGGSLAAIRREIDRGNPVIVLQFYTEVGKVPHWRVVRGYAPGVMIMSDSLGSENTALTDQDFVTLWTAGNLGGIYIPVRNS